MAQDTPPYLDELVPDQDVAALPEIHIETVMQEGLETCFTAAQIIVCHKGKVVWHRSYGNAGLTTLFDLASLTKLFTTTAFLSLAGESRVMLTLPIADVISEFAAIGVSSNGTRPVGEMHDPVTWGVFPPEEAYAGQRVNPRGVTFRHLLTHTGGLAPWPRVFERVGPVPPPEGITDPAERTLRCREAVEIICGYPFAGPPDSGIRYSDQGIILLGEAVARLHALSRERSRGTLDEAIRERVLVPMGLHQTMFNPTQTGVARARIAPTEFDGRWRVRRVHGEVHDENAAAMGGVAGHAGLFGTSHDLAIFGQAWLDCVLTGKAGVLPMPPNLAKEAVRLQEADQNTRRGFGWVLKATGEYSCVGKHMSLETFGHTGYTGTSLFIDPTRELLIAALTNRVYHGRDDRAINAFRPALHNAIVEALDEVANEVTDEAPEPV